MINILSNFSMLCHKGLTSGIVSILSLILAFLAKVMFNNVSVLVLSLSNVSWRVLRLQEGYVQDVHGRYVKQFKY